MDGIHTHTHTHIPDRSSMYTDLLLKLLQCRISTDTLTVLYYTVHQSPASG